MNRIFFVILLLLLSSTGSIFLLAQPVAENGYVVSNKDTAALLKEIKSAAAVADMDSAARRLNNAYQQSLALDFNEGKLKAALQLGKLYFRNGQYQQSIKHLEVAASWAARQKAYLGVICNDMGNAYNLLSQPDKAVVYYQRAAAYSEAYPNKSFSPSYAYNNLSTIMSQQEQYAKAVYYIEKAMPYAIRNHDTALLATLLLNKGISLSFEKKFEAAQQSFSAAVYYAEKIKPANRLFTILLNSASVALMANQPRVALQKLELARSLHCETEANLKERISFYSITGDTYIQLNNLSKAASSLRTAWSLSGQSPADQVFLLAKLSELEYRRGNAAEAYRLSGQYHQLKDSLYQKDITLHVQEMETRFRTLEKDKSLAQQTAYIASQHDVISRKNYWMAIMGLSFLLLVFIGILFYLRVKNRQRMQQRLAEIKRLQNIIEGEERERHRLAQELHDGVSSQLAGAQAYLGVLPQVFPGIAYTEAFLHTKSILTDAAKGIREISHNLLPNELSKVGLVTAIEHFISRSEGAGQTRFEFHAYGDFLNLAPGVALNVYRIIQEIVHNVIKHAAATDSIILLNKLTDEISIVAEDNGAGFDVNDERQTKSLGLHNMKDRVKAMSGTIQIESAPGKGTVITIFFPQQLAIVQPTS